MIRALLAGSAMVALLTGAADSRADRELADAIKGRVAQPDHDCIRLEQLQNPQVIGDRTLVYRAGPRTWVNRLENGCPGLGWDTIIVTDVYNGELCRNDHFRTIRRGTSIPGPTCRYGAFTPYVKAAAAN